MRDTTQRPQDVFPSDHERLQAVLDAFPLPVAVADREGNVTQHNQAWQALNAADPARHLSPAHFDKCGVGASPCEGAQAAFEGVQQVLAGKLPNFTLEYPCVTGATEHWTKLTACPLADGSGLLILVEDISETKRHEETMAHLAYHDALTGLPNRRLFREHAEQVLSLAKRSFQNVAFVAIDLNGFKAINDTYGHEYGDELLIEIARRLKVVFRETDVVARLGGDEFNILLPNVVPEQVHEVLERCERLVRQPVTLKGETVQVTGSIGVAIFPLHATSVKRLLRCADAAMYRAKEQGGGIVTFEDALGFS
jgi:diguanylate cyclase (GGDEF)-like protein